MVAAGEAGGILDTILKRLATYIEKAVKLKAQVKSAMIYPVAVIVIAVVVVGVILWKVIPTFAALFAGLGAELPLPTRIVIALSNFLVSFMPFIIVGIGAIGFALQVVLRHRRAAASIDGITAEAARARHCSCARSPWRGSAGRSATLLSSGVPILDGLDITARTAGNAIVEDAILQTRKSIERGETISAPLQARPASSRRW